MEINSSSSFSLEKATKMELIISNTPKISSNKLFSINRKALALPKTSSTKTAKTVVFKISGSKSNNRLIDPQIIVGKRITHPIILKELGNKNFIFIINLF